MARVLIVDDDEPIGRSLAAVLSIDKHECVCVTSGPEALRQLQQSAFDLLLTDIRMEPMDGVELMRRVRATNPTIPMLAVSAYGSKQAKETIIAAGGLGFVQKPFKIDMLLATVRDALRAAA